MAIDPNEVAAYINSITNIDYLMHLRDVIAERLTGLGKPTHSNRNKEFPKPASTDLPVKIPPQQAHKIAQIQRKTKKVGRAEKPEMILRPEPID